MCVSDDGNIHVDGNVCKWCGVQEDDVARAPAIRSGSSGVAGTASGRFKAIDPVILTDEERDECQRFLRSLVGEGQQLVVQAELAEEFKLAFMAMALMGRAERFSIVWDHERACTTAAKACGLYPSSINFYDFACVLRSAGKAGDAKAIFAEFLRRLEEVEQSPIDEVLVKHRDLTDAVADAREQVGA